MLAWSPARSQEVRSETPNVPVTRMAASASHAVVLGPIRRGSGGGAPVGRRWRLVRRAAGHRADRGVAHDAPDRISP